MRLQSVTLLSLLFTFSQCKKESGNTEPASQPVSFTSSSYENACTWDASGKPDCLLAPDNISTDLLNFVSTYLPEGRDMRSGNPSLLSGNAMADIAITQPSDVYITFVTQTTSLNNTLAFYTFPTNQAPKTASDIRKITYIFPNVKSSIPLRPGDKVKIGRFDAGTSIGFVLLQNAWNAQTRQPEKIAVHFCSNDALNPEINASLKKHAVLINYAPENKILVGFEDADRTVPGCDHDFNDVVIYATVTQ